MKKEYFENFELWAKECVKIIDKQTGQRVPFILNAPQRRVLQILEQQRLAQQPIRAIILKSRQWGCSTLIEIYLAWMQLVRHYGWNSIVCAHYKDAALAIKALYTRMLAEYPDRLKEENPKGWTFSPFEKSSSVSIIPARDCTVSVASSLSPNTARGSNLKMAHLSEIAFWADGNEKTAEEIVRAVCGTITRDRDTVVVMESTANGKENFFFKEWSRAVERKSDKTPIFVPWHEIEIYRIPLSESDRQTLLDIIDDYEKGLLAGGIPMEAVAWYHEKRKEYSTHEAMMAEFPSTPEEAFANFDNDKFFTDRNVTTLAKLPDNEGSSQAKICIAVLSGNSSAISIFSRHTSRRFNKKFRSYDVESRIYPVNDEIFTGTMSVLSAKLREIARREKCPVLIVEAVADDSTIHADYLSQRLLREGVELFTDDEEKGYIAVSNCNISFYADTYEEATLAGRMVETSSEVLEQLYSIGLRNYRRKLFALTRLLAASALTSLATQRVNLSDFLP